MFGERLYMMVANLTGAAGSSTALVGTSEQVVEAVLPSYDLGITTLLLKGLNPLESQMEAASTDMRHPSQSRGGSYLPFAALSFSVAIAA